MRGGYLIIDLNNVNFTSGVGMVVKGIYERIENSKKPIRLCNVSYEDIERRDVDVFLGVEDSSYVSPVVMGNLNLIVTINDNDVITFTTV